MAGDPDGHQLVHEALFYRNADELVSGVGGFVRDALGAGQAVMMAVPAPIAAVLRDGLDDHWTSDQLMLVDMAEVGRNPSRIISETRGFLDGAQGRPTTVVGETLWPGRDAEEITEVIRHEALINVAFASAPLRGLCSYDAAAVADEVLSDVRRTHPLVREPDGRVHPSPEYADPIGTWRSAGQLGPVPADADRLELDLRGLAGMRATVSRHGRRAGLHPDRVDDLVVAAHELVTNSVRHARSTARLHVWTEPTAVVCDVRDRGTLTDPLVGRSRPGSMREDGWGLWLVNQLCDLVQIHSGELGTAVRFRINR